MTRVTEGNARVAELAAAAPISAISRLVESMTPPVAQVVASSSVLQLEEASVTKYNVSSPLGALPSSS